MLMSKDRAGERSENRTREHDQTDRSIDSSTYLLGY
jgi:hypothetical protein